MLFIPNPLLPIQSNFQIRSRTEHPPLSCYNNSFYTLIQVQRIKYLDKTVLHFRSEGIVLGNSINVDDYYWCCGR